MILLDQYLGGFSKYAYRIEPHLWAYCLIHAPTSGSEASRRTLKSDMVLG